MNNVVTFGEIIITPVAVQYARPSTVTAFEQATGAPPAGPPATLPIAFDCEAFVDRQGRLCVFCTFANEAGRASIESWLAGLPVTIECYKATGPSGLGRLAAHRPFVCIARKA